MYEGHTLIKCLGEFPGQSAYCLLVKYTLYYQNQENRPDVQCSYFVPVFQP